MTLFLFLSIISMVGGLPSLHAGTQNSHAQTASNAPGVPDDEKTLEEQQGTEVDTESSEEEEEEETNTTATTTGPGPQVVTTAPSNPISENQTATTNNTEETSKPKMFARQLSPDILKDLQILTPSPPYKVRVAFDSMTVHNDHEGALSGDGEYDIAAYVQGIKVGLTDASGPGDGLWDVSSGETVTFDPGTEVTVDIPDFVPLSIITVGSEVDGCDRTSFPASIQDPIAKLIAKTPVGAIIAVTQMATTMEGIQAKINSAISWAGCKLNPNDVIGTINQAYEPVSYGMGTHAEKSSSGDFTLRYTISVTAPPLPQNEQSVMPSKLGNHLKDNLSVLQQDIIR